MKIHTIQRLRYEDSLQESLEKAQALTRIFGCAFLGEYDEETLQWFSAAILDNVRTANEAWKALQNMQKCAAE